MRQRGAGAVVAAASEDGRGEVAKGRGERARSPPARMVTEGCGSCGRARRRRGRRCHGRLPTPTRLLPILSTLAGASSSSRRSPNYSPPYAPHAWHQTQTQTHLAGSSSDTSFNALSAASRRPPMPHRAAASGSRPQPCLHGARWRLAGTAAASAPRRLILVAHQRRLASFVLCQRERGGLK